MVVRNMANDYWQKRYERILDEAFQKATLTDEEIKKQYARALRRMEKAINDWYRRFANENGITLQEARKLLDKYEMKAFKMDLKEFEKEAKQFGMSKEHQQMLSNASIRERLSREQMLYINMVHEIEVMAHSQNVSVKNMLDDVYRSSVYKSAYTAQTQRGSYSMINSIDGKRVDSVINSQWANDGQDFSSRIWSDKVKLVANLQNDFTQALMIGQGADTMANNLSKRMKTSYSNAKRLVETETARVHEQGFLDSMAELDVDKLEILATLDSHTSPICRRMDRKIVRRVDAKPGVTVPPFHCYCRSTTIPYIEGVDGEIRTGRNKDDKSTDYDGAISYEEWEKQYIS